MKKIVVFCSITCSIFFYAWIVPQNNIQFDALPKLSDYGFFSDLKSLKPKEGIIPYYLINSMFVDHAKSIRFVVLPSGQRMQLKQNEWIELPLGSILIKHFYYPKDFRKANENWQHIETRLFKRTEEGWKAATYVWTADQTEALLNTHQEGIDQTVSWLDKNGEEKSVNYHIASYQECLYCHNSHGSLEPIGIKSRYLNFQIRHEPLAPEALQAQNQLQFWQAQGWLDTELDLTKLGSLASMEDLENTSLAQRARAWLDVNCAHCHIEGGTAQSAGLRFSYLEEEPERLGINKAYGGRYKKELGRTVIQPGDPEKSVLWKRIQAEHIYLRMPNIGVQTIDTSGVALIRDWILTLN